MKDFGAKAVKVRQKSGGQIFTGIKAELDSLEALSVFYTPGIAQPCQVIADDPAQGKVLTLRRNTVAVVSDGSAVLGLGNIGAQAALPVMEGKCMLMKHFADVDGFPIVLDTQDTEEIIQIVKAIAPTFGGINLEDIAAPRCFEIEARLSAELDIFVFHDDQHGTAMVVLAALHNALQVVDKKKEAVKVAISGAGAAGIAIARLLRTWGVEDIKMVDSKGIVFCNREGELPDGKKEFCTWQEGTLADSLKGADVFIGVSKGGIVSQEMVESMNEKAIIFAMANPVPEIMPDVARAGGAAVVATGRSDFPNQTNNSLIFPGFFRGLLDTGQTQITEGMKLAAALALAVQVPQPTAEKILPGPLDPGVAEGVAKSLERF